MKTYICRYYKILKDAKKNCRKGYVVIALKSGFLVMSKKQWEAA